MESKRVVVTGLGAITPIGNTVKEFPMGVMAPRPVTTTRFDSMEILYFK